MDLSNSLKNFIQAAKDNFNLKEPAKLNVFEVLTFFYENGYDYLNSSSVRVMDYFKKYKKEIEKTKTLHSDRENEYKIILKDAMNIAEKSMSRDIDINHFIMATIHYWSKISSVPDELILKTNIILQDRSSIRHRNLKNTFNNRISIKRINSQSHKIFKPHHFEKTLREKIVLNREFVSEIASILSLKFIGLDLKPYLPNGIFLFIGKKSSGKSEFAYSIAETVYGSRETVSEIDLSLINVAQPEDDDNDKSGLQGNFFKSIVSEGTNRVFLIKNLESMEKGFFMLLSQIFSKGNLHLKSGRLDFSDSIFVLTINKDIITSLTKTIGFQSETNEESNLAIKETIKKDFGEEFISYFDGIYIFQDLTLDDYIILFRRKFQQIKEMALKRNLELSISKDVIGKLAALYIQETKIIPNQLGRFIEQKVLIPLVKKIKKDPDKKKFRISLYNDKIKIS